MTLPSRDRSRLLGYLLQHLAFGLIGGAVFIALVWFSDLGNLRTLIMGSPDWAEALVLLGLGISVTFGGVGLAWGIFHLNGAPDDK